MKLFKYPIFKSQTAFLLMLGVLCLVASAFGNMALGAGAALATVAGIGAPTFNKDGLSGNELELIEKMEKRFKPMMTEEHFIRSVRSAFKELCNEKGDLAFPVEKLIELLGDSDKGVRAILRTQGEELAKLKTATTTPMKLNLRSLLESNMDKIQALFEKREGAGKEFNLNLRAPAIMTTANTITGLDLLPDDLIESFSIGAFVPKRQPREYVFDVANRRTVPEIQKYKTWLEEGNEEGAFAIVAEGGLKPLVSTSLVRNFSEAFKVAGKHIVTDEFAKFRKEAYSIIERIINQKLLRDYAAILTTKLVADAAPYVGSALDGQYTNPTDYHAIAAVAAQIESLDFFPDLLVLNPQDKWRIGMSQNTQGSFYMQIPVVDPTGNTTLMGFTVRTSNRIAVGTFLLGEAGLWEIEEEAIQVRIGYGITTTSAAGNITSVEDDFDHNRFRVIAETYASSYCSCYSLVSSRARR
jgi:hypothetical protein